MAHIFELDVRCKRCVKRRACVEVFNSQNASEGKYCRVCGAKRLEEVKRREKAEYINRER